LEQNLADTPTPFDCGTEPWHLAPQYGDRHDVKMGTGTMFGHPGFDPDPPNRLPDGRGSLMRQDMGTDTEFGRADLLTGRACPSAGPPVQAGGASRCGDRHDVRDADQERST